MDKRDTMLTATLDPKRSIEFLLINKLSIVCTFTVLRAGFNKLLIEPACIQFVLQAGKSGVIT